MKLCANKPYSWLIFLLIVFFLFPSQSLLSQSEKKKEKKAKKSVVEKTEHSPHKATLWALLPGAGQIYNKKYWKLPIVYAGFGVIGYFVYSNRKEYVKYNDAYICSAQADNDTSFVCNNPLGSQYETSYLQSYRDYYRRNLELTWIVMGLWYILQILDATVDAHLFHWEVDDNITVRLDPIYKPVFLPKQRPAYNGLKVTLRF